MLIIIHQLILIIKINKFLKLGERPTDGINDSSDAAEKNNFSKAMTKVCLSLNKTEICRIQANDNIRWYYFCSGSISKHFTKDKQCKMFVNSSIFNFSDIYSSIKKEDILHIHEYLMVKSNIAYFLGLLKNIYWIIN